MNWEIADRAAAVITAIFMALATGLIVWLVYDALTADTFALRKDSWQCTASHRESTGKFMVTVCDQWTRR